MFRALVVALVLSSFVTPASAQAPPAPGTAPAQTTPSAKPAKKPATKAKTTTRPAAPTDTGPCQIGVISAIGDQFSIQKVGIMVFGNELADASVAAWGLDDVVVARVRAAAAGSAVRKITFARDAFAVYDNPPAKLFRNRRDDLTEVVRQIKANANCERYFVFTKLTTKLDGTNQTLHGLGVLNQGAGAFTRVSLFASYQLTVLNGQTFEIYKSPHANLGAILTGAFTRNDAPNNELDRAAFPASAAEAAASPTLRERTRAYLAATLDKTLPAYFKQE